LKTTVLALLLLAIGCGDKSINPGGPPIGVAGGGGTVGGSLDLAVVQFPLDFAGTGNGGMCTSSTVQVACGGTECVACLTLGTSGICVLPCKMSSPSCPSGTSCGSFGDGGSADLVFGGACGGYDGICQ
jgi:hypothetical protein